MPKGNIKLQRALDQDGVPCWATDIRHLLHECGESEFWDQPVSNLKAFKHRIQNKMLELSREKWEAEARSKITLNLYIENKTRNRTNNVLEMNHPERRALLNARFNTAMFVEKVTVDNTMLWRCKICHELVERSWKHIIHDCPRTGRIRQECGLQISAYPDSIMFSQNKEGLAKYIIRCERRLQSENIRDSHLQ